MERNLRSRSIFHDIWVEVKRQDSSLQNVRLGTFYPPDSVIHYFLDFLDDEFCEFLKTNFPHYNEKMVTVPVSFQYKNLRTHGIVSDDGERKGGEKSKEWIKATSGLRAEQKIFDEIQSQFSHQPCLLINGFSENNLIKVVKSKLKQDKKGIQLSDQVKLGFVLSF